MVDAEGAFLGTRSRIAIPFNYDQPSSSTGGALSPKPLRHLFQWSDDEGEVNAYASSATVSSVQTGRVSANVADNNNDNDLYHSMKAQK